MNFFDLHCDTLTRAWKEGHELSDPALAVNTEKMRSLSRYAQVFAIFVPDELRGEAAWRYTCGAYDWWQRAAERLEEAPAPVKTPTELADALQAGRVAALLSVEGGAALGGELSRLEELRRWGVWMMTLTWNGGNEIGSGSLRQKQGLTGFGREAVAEMGRLGMWVDISHLSDAGVEDVFRETDAPLIATHSNARAVCGHRRNLPDEFIRELVLRGGLIGLNFYRDFLNDEPERAGFSDVARHIERFFLLGAEKILACGSDFDGCRPPECLDSLEKVNDLARYLRELGLDDKTLEKIFWQNARDFLGVPQKEAAYAL